MGCKGTPKVGATYWMRYPATGKLFWDVVQVTVVGIQDKAGLATVLCRGKSITWDIRLRDLYRTERAAVKRELKEALRWEKLANAAVAKAQENLKQYTEHIQVMQYRLIRIDGENPKGASNVQSK